MESSAIALVFLGLTVALVTGVPLGTRIGQIFGWRSAFIGVVLPGVIVLFASAALVPSSLRQDVAPGLRRQERVLTSPVATIFVIAIWGGFAFANVPPLQVYTVQIARDVAPDAADAASGHNIEAFNLGIALGAWFGGVIVESIGLAAAPFPWRRLRFFRRAADPAVRSSRPGHFACSCGMKGLLMTLRKSAPPASPRSASASFA